MENVIQEIAVYAIPVLFAITVHEAAHGYVARHVRRQHGLRARSRDAEPGQAHRPARHDRHSPRHGAAHRLHVRLGQARAGRLGQPAQAEARHDLGRGGRARRQPRDGRGVGAALSLAVGRRRAGELLLPGRAGRDQREPRLHGAQPAADPAARRRPHRQRPAADADVDGVLAHRAIRPVHPAGADVHRLPVVLPASDLQTSARPSCNSSADHVSRSRPLRNAPDGRAAPRPLPRRAEELGSPAERASVPVLRGRLARADDALLGVRDDRGQHLGHGDRLAGRRRRSVAGDALHPVARAGARRTLPAAVDGHAARLARTRADLQGPAGEAQRPRPRDLRLPRLSAAAGRRHPDLPRHHGAGGRGPGPARRDDARDRAPLQPPVRLASPASRRRRATPSRSSARVAPSGTRNCARSTRKRARSTRSSRRAR